MVKMYIVLEVVEVVLAHFNFVDNQFQQKSEVLYTFTQNKSYDYLLNVEASNLVLLKPYCTEFNETTTTFIYQNSRPLEMKPYNTEFDEDITTFMYQNSRPSEIERKVNLRLVLINRNDTLFYRTKNKKIRQKICIFVIREKSNYKNRKKIIGYCC